MTLSVDLSLHRDCSSINILYPNKGGPPKGFWGTREHGHRAANCTIVYSVFGLIQSLQIVTTITGRKNRALQVPLVVPYKALRKFPNALYGTTGGNCSARFFHPVTSIQKLFGQSHYRNFLE